MTPIATIPETTYLTIATTLYSSMFQENLTSTANCLTFGVINASIFRYDFQSCRDYSKQSCIKCNIKV